MPVCKPSGLFKAAVLLVQGRCTVGSRPLYCWFKAVVLLVQGRCTKVE